MHSVSATTGAASNATATTTLQALVQAYVSAYAGRDRSRPATLGWWAERLGHRPFVEITDDEVFRVLDELAHTPARAYAGRDAEGKPIFRAKGSRSPASVNRYHQALSALFTWAAKRRLAPRSWENPARRVERLPEKNQVVRFLSDSERERLLEACRRSSWPRLYLLVIMAITTGARRGELLALTWADVDLGRALAYVRSSKNDQPRTLTLTPAVVAELARFRSDRPEIRVFPARGPQGLFQPRAFEKSWLVALKEAGIRGFRFHDLRHTCASYLAQQGASLLEIADVMGHRQLAMVKRYAHLTVETKAQLVNRVLGGIK